MINNHYNPIKTLSFTSVISVLFALTLCHNANAQEAISAHVNCPSEYCIIRHYRNMIDIKFEILNYGQPPSFYYVNHGTNTALEFQLPLHTSVKDFEIDGQYVFFCGTAIGSKPIFGYFNIDSLFFMGGNIHYSNLLFNPIPFYSNNINYKVTNLRKIEAYNISGVPHIIMLGSVDVMDASDVFQYSCTAILEAKQNPLSAWELHYSIETYDSIRYSDVAVTNKYVVIAGTRKINDSVQEHCIIPYVKQTPATANLNIFNMMYPGLSGYMPTFCTHHSIFHTDYYDIHAVSMAQDTFATFCYDLAHGGRPIIATFYRSPFSDPFSRFSFGFSTSRIEDFAFLQGKNVLGITVSFIYSSILQIKAPYTSVGSVSFNEPYLWRSIDVIPEYGLFTISGTSPYYNEGKYWIYNPDRPRSNCYDTGGTTGHPIITNQYVYQLEQRRENIIFNWLTDTPNISSKRIIIECE